MRFTTTVFVALLVPALLAGCFGDGGGGRGTTYDGTWTVAYTDPADIPTPIIAGQTVACSNPAVALTLVNGSGSATQTMTCVFSTPSDTQTKVYLISVAISDAGVTNAIVNGSPLTGTCISTVGCSAQSGSKALSITR